MFTKLVDAMQAISVNMNKNIAEGDKNRLSYAMNQKMNLKIV